MMSNNTQTEMRPFARVIAHELTSDEIDMVAGGMPNTGGCSRTLTGCEQSRDGEIACGDTDVCPA
jgi:hypothetical protein